MTAAPLLEMRGISKRFPGVVALDSVSLQIGRGEVVAVCGENGAGKSTLMKILGGVHQPDAGEILVDGHPVKINNVTDAMKLGIAFIHQELNVLENLDIAANVFLGREPRNSIGLINRKKIHADTGPFIKRLGLQISTRTRLDRLSIAHQQMVEIAKALSLNARLIIMDEPTSSLTLSETKRLLELVCELAEQGVSVIYISHRLGEIDQCADRVVVLRDGKNAGELEHEESTHDKLVNLMVGREIKSFYVQSEAPKEPGLFQSAECFVVAAIRAKPFRSMPRAGKFLASPGWSAQAVRKWRNPSSVWTFAPAKEILLDGEKISINKTRDAIDHGIYLVPENRRTEGLVVEMTVRENISLPSLENFSRLGLISRRHERKIATEQVKSLRRQNARHRDAGLELERRQPAESRARQMAGDDAARDDFGRADARH